MSNEQIIAKTAIAAGLFTEEEILDYMTKEQDVPLHSVMGWKMRSPKGYEYRIKKGEHGLECRLWQKRKHKDKPEEDYGKDNKKLHDFYLVKTYLFDKSQVEMVKITEC